MRTVSQPGDLSPQDMQRYFGWPPPPPPARPKKRWYLRTFIRLLVLYFVLILPVFGCNGAFEEAITNTSRVSNDLANIFGIVTLAFLVAEVALLAYMIYRGLRKQRIIVAPSPPVPTDREYEDWVRSWQHPLRQYGMQKLGLDEDVVLGRSLYVRSLVWPGSPWSKYYQSYNTPIRIKYGADGRPHSSINRYTFFYPTQHYIAVFMGDINALDSTRFEGTRTYFYDDIVGIETSAVTLNDGNVTYAMQHFELRVSSGQSIGATTYVHDLDVDQTVNALRTLLRDKKYGIQGGGYDYLSP